MPVPARRLPSWVWVTGLTAGAVAAVVVLTVQADRGPHPTATAARPSASANPRPSASKSARPTAVPGDSGTGRRVVYSLGQKRVWLVDASDVSRRSFAVWPGTVGPDPGSYTISQRTEATTGSDGVEIEHILYFAAKSGRSIAFSNAVDGSSPPPASGIQTSGIRMNKADGSALWTFGETGTTVVVVR
ncbi:L,D-transpeptidase [Streptomyces cellulosae]|uniref:L,D-transpeptidase n=1 Tax=Streptomyces cellulosae TaxID=1968 RepID=UPI00068D13F5|nr:L,D-transpeptidase [Streptomyces cellulosae]